VQVVLFLFQLEMDSQLQRALTYERFDMAQEVRLTPAGSAPAARRFSHPAHTPETFSLLTRCILRCRHPPTHPPPPLFPRPQVRARRQQVDAALRELQQLKGPGCGARVASRSDALDYAPAIMTAKAQMEAAAAEERYDEAAALRDRLRELEGAAAAAADAASQYLCPVGEPRYALGEVVVHASKGYRGVVCGWDLACCEGDDWQRAAGVE
jgi:hypothetical protein